MKRRRRPRRKYQKYIRKVSIFIVLTSLILLFLWPYLRITFLKILIPIGRGEAGVLEEKVCGDAIFTGGETLLVAPTSGSIRFFVKDKDSVRVGDVIAEIGDKDVVQAITESLAFAEEKLEKYQSETAEEFVRLSQEIQDSYENAIHLFFQVQQAYSSGDFKNLAAKENQLFSEEKTILDRRSRLSALESERAKLTKEVELIQKIASTSTVKILAPIAGTFSSKVTKLDEKVFFSDLSDKDASQLMILAKELKNAKAFSLESGCKVNQGQVIGRIVSGDKVSFFLPVKTEERPDIEPGKPVLIQFPDKTTLDAVVNAVIDGKPPGYSILVGVIEYVPFDKYEKTARIWMITKRHSGIIVPVKSLLEKNGQTGVLIVRKTFAQFCPVDVLMIKGEQAVVRGIQETDEIVLRPMKLLEGRRVR